MSRAADPRGWSAMALFAGLSVEHVLAVQPAREIVDELMGEADRPADLN